MARMMKSSGGGYRGLGAGVQDWIVTGDGTTNPTYAGGSTTDPYTVVDTSGLPSGYGNTSGVPVTPVLQKLDITTILMWVGIGIVADLILFPTKR